ncbi:hypothetical protein [Spiroplasma endosymbiont of Aspidapion aeneum]|uniref:hypothetical protein n=1 Tax=Spiroplasma endosymbiont of Aspidapion aeneum TaxID=3066276 RepID=UPI00313D636E
MFKEKNKFYYQPLWYLKFFLTIIFFISLCLGFYFCCFKDDWYLNEISFTFSANASTPEVIRYPYTAFWNAEALLSFYSVQVALITFVFLLSATIFHKFEEKVYILSTRFKNILVCWNMIMIMIFWYGAFNLCTIKGGLSEYCTSQLVLSLVTHFFCPVVFIFYVYLNGCKSNINIKQCAYIDLTLTLLYPIVYFFYIILRAKLIMKNDTFAAYNKVWVPSYWYDFMNFDNPMLNVPKPLYYILFLIFFIILYSIIWFGLTYISNKINSYKVRKGWVVGDDPYSLFSIEAQEVISKLTNELQQLKEQFKNI